MQAEIHPNYEEVDVTCSCGNNFKTRSTAGHALTIDVCDMCHPFYTGKQKVLDTEGKIDTFKKRYGGFAKMAAKKKDDSDK